MKKSMLIELLSKFSPKEMKEFTEFVHSPFFNKNQSVISFFEYLRKQYPVFDRKSVDKKQIYSTIFPDIEYNDGFMRTLMFNLCSLAENYISYACFKDDYYMDKRYLLYELNNRNQNRLFEKNHKTVSKRFEDECVKDEDYFFNKYNIDFEKIHYLHRINPDKLEKIIPGRNPEDIMDSLTNYYLIQSMDHYLYFLNIMELYKYRFNLEKYENIIKVIKIEEFREVPVIELYYYLINLFISEGDISFFYKTADFLKKKTGALNKNQMHQAYLNLKNYCKRKIMKGDNRFEKELFDIYKIELEKKIYSLHDEMSFRYYTGVVETALRLKNYDWAIEFIEKYKCELTENSRENTYVYSVALYEFSLKNFEKSLELLSKVKYNDVYHKLKYRSLLAMLYYELDYGDLLMSHLDSFNHFILNDSIVTNERKEHYSDFVKYLKQLNSPKEQDKNHTLYKLTGKIIENTAAYNKEWLLEKIEELKRKH